MRKQKGKKGPKAKEEEEEEEEQVVDILNFPSSFNPHEAKYETWLLLACAAVVSSVYISTLFPSVPGGDSGELIIAAHQLGVAHPPGYPLFTLLGKLFTYLPFGSPAWRVNLMSALCGVLSAVFMYRTVARWSGNHAAGLLSAAIFAFSPLVWSYTIQAEVFSLNNLLVNTLIYLVVNYAYYYSTKQNKYIIVAYLGALVGGFGVSNQHTIVFLFVPIVVWIFFIVGRKDFLYVPRRWLILAGFALLGLAPYLHMLLSPHINQRKYSWGDTGSVGGFIHHFLRKEYGTFKLYSGNLADESGWGTRVNLYFSRLAGEVLYLGIPLAVIGLWASLRGISRPIYSSVGFLLAFCFFFYITVFYYLTNLPIQSALHLGVLLRFFMQPNAIVCVWIGLGFAYLERKWTAGGHSRIVTLLIAALVATAQVTTNYSFIDQHHNTLFYHYGKSVLEPLPPNAILLAGGDLQTNIPFYVQLCESIRPDVDILSVETMSWDWHIPRQGPLYPNVTFPGKVYHPFKKSGYSMKQFLDANYNKRPMFIAGEWKVGDPSIENYYVTQPYGLSQRIYPQYTEVDVFKHAAYADKAMQVLNMSTWQPYKKSAKYGPETWEYMVFLEFWAAYEKRANMFLIQGFKREADSEKCIKEAIKILEFIKANRGESTRWLCKYLGAAYDYMRLWYPHDGVIRKRIVEEWTEYLSFGPDPKDPEYLTVKDAVAKFSGNN